MNYHTRRYEHSCCPKRSWFCFKLLGSGVSASNPCLSWLCVRLKQSTFQGSLLWRFRSGKCYGAKDRSSPHTTVQYIANLDLCLFSQASPSFSWSQDALKDFINWTCQMRRVPGNQPQCISGWALCLFLGPMMCLNTPLMFVCSLE